MFYLFVHYAATGWCLHEFDTEEGMLRFKAMLESEQVSYGYRSNRIVAAREFPEPEIVENIGIDELAEK